jgi:uncharacterized protein
MQFIYLHGFASSPQSAKAQFFRKKFAAPKFVEQGMALEIPRLDQGDLKGLSITGQLQVVERAVGDGPAILMGSSLGGYLAALFAARHSSVEKLVLLAPAFQFPRRWRERYSSEDLALWKLHGSIPVFHYGYQEERPLGYQIVEDAQRYEDEPEFPQPALVLHGIHDDVVPVEISRAYAARHANVSLRLFDSGHELTNVLEGLWEETARFLWALASLSLCLGGSVHALVAVVSS